MLTQIRSVFPDFNAVRLPFLPRNLATVSEEFYVCSAKEHYTHEMPLLCDERWYVRAALLRAEKVAFIERIGNRPLLVFKNITPTMCNRPLRDRIDIVRMGSVGKQIELELPETPCAFERRQSLVKDAPKAFGHLQLRKGQFGSYGGVVTADVPTGSIGVEETLSFPYASLVGVTPTLQRQATVSLQGTMDDTPDLQRAFVTAIRLKSEGKISAAYVATRFSLRVILPPVDTDSLDNLFNVLMKDSAVKMVYPDERPRPRAKTSSTSSTSTKPHFVPTEELCAIKSTTMPITMSIAQLIAKSLGSEVIAHNLFSTLIRPSPLLQELITVNETFFVGPLRLFAEWDKGNSGLNSSRHDMSSIAAQGSAAEPGQTSL